MPSTVLPIIAAVPGVIAVTTPSTLTFATSSLPHVQTTVLLEASNGVITGFSAKVPPTFKVAVFCIKLIPVKSRFVTLTMHTSTFSPSTVLTTITVIPTVRGVTTPVVLTVATASLLLLQVTALFAALLGAITALKVNAVPTIKSFLSKFRATPVACTLVSNIGPVTVTLHVAFLVLSN